MLLSFLHAVLSIVCVTVISFYTYIVVVHGPGISGGVRTHQATSFGICKRPDMQKATCGSVSPVRLSTGCYDVLYGATGDECT